MARLIVTLKRSCIWCGSRNLSRTGILGGIVGHRYQCRTCGEDFVGIRILGVRVSWG
jgi:hypothetical protein